MVAPVPPYPHADSNPAPKDHQSYLFAFGYMGIRDHIEDLWKVLSHHRTRGINHVTAISAAVLVYLGGVAASQHTLGWLGSAGVAILMLVAVTSLLMSWHNVTYWLAGLPNPYLSPGNPPGHVIRSDYIEYRPEIIEALCNQRSSMMEAICFIEKWQRRLRLPYGVLIGSGVVFCVMDLTLEC